MHWVPKISDNFTCKCSQYQVHFRSLRNLARFWIYLWTYPLLISAKVNMFIICKRMAWLYHIWAHRQHFKVLLVTMQNEDEHGLFFLWCVVLCCAVWISQCKRCIMKFSIRHGIKKQQLLSRNKQTEAFPLKSRGKINWFSHLFNCLHRPLLLVLVSILTIVECICDIEFQNKN